MDEVRLDCEDQDSDQNDDEEFCNTWIPSNLHQIGDFAQLDKDIDELAKGNQVLVSKLLAPSREEKKEIASRTSKKKNKNPLKEDIHTIKENVRGIEGILTRRVLILMNLILTVNL